MLKNLPNFLTLFRIFLIPILIISFYIEGNMAHYVASIIFVFASITDFFDGYLARLLKAQSEFGRVLDPIADKLLVASALMMLVHFDRAPIVPCIAILCREILVSGLREHLAEIKIKIQVSSLGKVKTAFQMIAITTLLLGDKIIPIPHILLLGQATLWIAAILTIISGYFYCEEGFKHI